MSWPDELRPIIGIHQPNFFPWLGFFHKIRWSDTFVLLDDVQIYGKSGSVTNRVAFTANDKQLYVTAPIKRVSSAQRINEVEIAERPEFRDKLVAFLRQTYGKTPHFKALSERVFALVTNPTSTLALYNERAILDLAELLGLATRIVRSSEHPVDTTSTLRLVDLVAALGGKTYLAGQGATQYQEDRLFFERGIGICSQLFVGPEYPRGAQKPAPGLSVLDALFHLGVEGTRELLERPLDPVRYRFEAPQ